MTPQLPRCAHDEFPGLERPGEDDLSLLERQLGRNPRGEVYVARRCPHGIPAVILTVPFDNEGRPTPPLLWLSCPYACREAARLESERAVRRFSESLARAGEDALRFEEEEERFGLIQSEIAWSGGEVPTDRLRERGVAGGRRGSIKCLHAHLAYRLASGRGVVGGWCLDEIEQGTGCWCEKIPEACLT